MLIIVKNNINEISRVCDIVRKFCEEHNVSNEKCHDITLILDEIITNIVNYAYPDNKEHELSVDIDKIGVHITLRLVDSGIAFDPLAQADPDVESSLEERKVGGLGIFIAKQLSDELKYSRINGQNQLDIRVAIYSEGKDNGN
ncbi:MAG: ATP-binding protein [Holosporaceae bacterium]|jgi:anti-sigma regulatory factor (Ser/Thr protein kinase)|nr:ATP-binding protein [Holosporaceae bacterium]